MTNNRFIKLLQKTIKDELSASIFYKRAAENVYGPTAAKIIDELMIHADEEFNHFKLLVNYASNYALDESITYSIDKEVCNFDVKNLNNVVQKVQQLEKLAIIDYKELLSICQEINDEIGILLFQKLIKDESDHYDDLAYYFGNVRLLDFESDKDKAKIEAKELKELQQKLKDSEKNISSEIENQIDTAAVDSIDGVLELEESEDPSQSAKVIGILKKIDK